MGTEKEVIVVSGVHGSARMNPVGKTCRIEFVQVKILDSGYQYSKHD